MRYLTLAEALTIAELVTGLEAVTLAKVSRLELLDSALHAPQAGFGDEDFYPSIEQAAVLAVRIARNHPPARSTVGWAGPTSSSRPEAIGFDHRVGVEGGVAMG